MHELLEVVLTIVTDGVVCSDDSHGGGVVDMKRVKCSLLFERSSNAKVERTCVADQPVLTW
jgi:hypothetical protein